jgi:hypothetical protein
MKSNTRTCRHVSLPGILTIAVISMAFVGQLSSQRKPVTNDDVINMVNSGLAENTILAVIQTSPANFDTSVSGLIALKKAGVSQNVIDAVLRAPASKPASSIGTPPAPPPPVPRAPGVPSVVFLPPNTPAGAQTINQATSLQLEKTQLSQTKTRATSLGVLANGSISGQLIQAGVGTAAMEGMIHSGSTAGWIAANQGGGIAGTALSRRPKPEVTYVWAIPGSDSPFQTNVNTPCFQVEFAGMMNLNPDDFEPAIVKLTPTTSQPAWRLVGATQGKEDVSSKSAMDWQVYSSFLEDQVPVRRTRHSAGNYEIAVTSPLEPGEYGVVLRPVSRSFRFSGADIARNQGAGKAFNSVWAFKVR